MENPKHPTLLSPQQQSVLSRLLPVARIATDGSGKGLPVQPRCHTMIIGPSGSGKSFVAKTIGAKLGLPTMIINVSSWVVLSARNEPWTFSSICQWLDSLQGGGILVLDEIDKIGGPTDWQSYIRLEAHDLLDGMIPLAARMPCMVLDEPWEFSSQTAPAVDRESLARKLRERVFILGCGAWQSAWNSNSRTLGFSTKSTAIIELPGRNQILNSIEPELRQRFRNEVCWMAPMALADYHAVSSEISEQITNIGIRGVWDRLAGPAIEQAVSAGLGMRVFEELMLSALLETRVINGSSIGAYELPDM